MAYEIQIKTRELIHDEWVDIWQSVRPTRGEPYKFENRLKAIDTLHKLYPMLTTDRMRLKKV